MDRFIIAYASFIITYLAKSERMPHPTYCNMHDFAKMVTCMFQTADFKVIDIRNI